MKVIIAGSRGITDLNLLIKAVNKAYDEEGISVWEIISGGARGVDQLAEDFAKQTDIPITIMLADWVTHGKKAGILRNIDMANSGAEALIALWDGESKGTGAMINIAKRKGLKVFSCNTLLERLDK